MEPPIAGDGCGMPERCGEDGMGEVTKASEIKLPEQEPLSVEQWERIAQFLFARLDDIDTASDIAKSNDDEYRILVGHAHRRRFEVAATDGYRVVFKTGATRPPTTGRGGREEV